MSGMIGAHRYQHHEPHPKPDRLAVLEQTKDDVLAREAATILRLANGDVNRLGIDACDGHKELIIAMAMRIRDQMMEVTDQR